ncbi:hypothetical protein PQZ43_02765 [Alphaproteobacteria bacterium]|nr:hypothetical protein [Alphaproteobacteria bacterium]
MINTLTTYKSSLPFQVISDDVSIKNIGCFTKVNSIYYYYIPVLIERFHDAKINNEPTLSYIYISKDINIIALPDYMKEVAGV